MGVSYNIKLKKSQAEAAVEARLDDNEIVELEEE